MSDADLSTDPPPASPYARYLAMLSLVLLFAWLSAVFWNSAKPLPPGTHVVSQTARLSEGEVEFVLGSPGPPTTLNRGLAAIDRAEQLIVIDRSPVTPELSQHLLARKRMRPNIKVVLVTDPANEAFAGTPARTLLALEQAGIIVARVNLDRLRDSNPLYSGLWRMVFGWWSDPFEEAPGQITAATWSRMQNCKADRRQLLVADDGSGGWTAIMAPTGGFAGLILRGPLAHAMISSELQIAAWSTDDDRLPPGPQMADRGVGSIDARFLTEGAMAAALLDTIDATGKGDRMQIAAEILGERRIVAAMLRAVARGARLQVLLARVRMPNSAVAGELLRDGGGRIEVRWYPAAESEPHPRLLVVRHRADIWMNLSAGDFTRRNLDDLNLGAAVELRMPARAAPARAVADYFSQLWSNAAEDPNLAEESAAGYWRYRFAEATGLSSY